MKHSSGRTVIVSKTNSTLTRVFIPEKIQVNGVRFVVPYKVSRFAMVTQAYSVAGGVQSNLLLSFGITTVVLTTPFSFAMLQAYLSNAIALRSSYRPGTSKELLVDSLQDERQLSAEELEQYLPHKTGNTKTDGKLIISMTKGKMITAVSYVP